MFEKLNNGGIFLSRFEQQDSQTIFQAVIDSKHEISPWFSWLTPQYCQIDANDFVTLQIDNWNKNLEYTFTIKNIQGSLLGIIGLHIFDPQNDVASIGYWIHTKYTGKGYCTQALRLLINNALKPLNLIRIELLIATKNIASQRVAEKAGGIFEATLKNRIRLNGLAVDANIYAFVAG